MNSITWARELIYFLFCPFQQGCGFGAEAAQFFPVLLVLFQRLLHPLDGLAVIPNFSMFILHSAFNSLIEPKTARIA